MVEERSVERRLVTILFADLVGFTALSEGLDAEDVAAVQDRYFAQVRTVLGRYGGRLEKFIGDAAMAVFGLPRTRDDDAERAVRAGLALVSAIEALATDIGLAEGSLRLRVGVNSGEVAYGTDADGAWRVSGDSVNVAARLQAAADPGAVLVGDATALAVAEVIALDRPVALELKGKAEPVRAWRAAAVLPHRSREQAMGALRAPLLGRSAEMALLRAELEQARLGQSRALLIVAPPGVGKTRLVEEFAASADEVWRARLTPQANSPAAVVGQLLAAALAEAKPEAGARTEIERRLVDVSIAPERASALASVLLEAPGAAPAADEVPQFAAASLADQRSARFHDWIEGLDGLAHGAATWLLEDLHWATGDVLALLDQLADQPAPRGRLVLATGRPALLEQVAARAPATGNAVELIELAPLDPRAAGELITELVGDALPAELGAAIVERSDGNALFIEELLRSWVSLGTLVHEAGRWRLAASPDEVALPQTVQAIYAAQLDDLPDLARGLARRGAVAGRHVPRASLPALDVEPDGEAVEVVLRRALMRESPIDPVSGPALGYRHVLLRDAGYASLSRAERARLHARLASWYEHVAGDRVGDVAEQIAGHYGAAIDSTSRLQPVVDDGLDLATARERAWSWYERAARRALAAAAHETGRRLLAEALRHATGAPVPVEARLQLLLGETTAYTSDMDEGAALVTAALDGFRAAHADGYHDDAELRAGYGAAAAALGRIWEQQLRFADAGQLADETLAAIGPPDDETVARLLAIRGWVRSTLTEEHVALDDLDRALAIARTAGNRQLELEMLDARAAVLGELGLLEEMDWAAVEELARELNDGSRSVRAMRARAGFLLDDEHDRVWPIANEAEEIARRLGRQEDLAWIDYLRAEAGLVSGDWDSALVAGLRGVELGERNSYHRAVVRTWHALLPIADARGERAIIDRAFAWYTAMASVFPDSPYGRIVGTAAHLVFMSAGLEPYEVPAVEPRLPSFNNASGGPSWMTSVERVLNSWLDAGELGGAADAVDRLERAVVAEPTISAFGRGSVLLLRARLLTAQNESLAVVSQAAREALAQFRQAAAPWWIARTLRVLAGVGDASTAEEEELTQISRSLGLKNR